MDIVQARIDITNWITGFVEQPNVLLQGWAPCPYARAARLNKQVRIDAGLGPWLDLRQISWHGLGDHEVIIMVYDPREWPLDRFRGQWQSAQHEFLAPRGLICLEDHPADFETVNGVVMNQGDWALLLIQDLNRLQSAAAQLADRGYYDTWTAEYRSRVFAGRQDPTQ